MSDFSLAANRRVLASTSPKVYEVRKGAWRGPVVLRTQQFLEALDAANQASEPTYVIDANMVDELPNCLRRSVLYKNRPALESRR